MTDAEKAIHNERTKLRATMFNNVGIALFVAGLVVPFVNFAYSGRQPEQALWPLVALIWLALGLTLHQVGFRYLGRMK